MVFTKKSQLFWQGFPRLILVVTFISYFTSDCFAGAAKVLSDEELDNVQAEGLYFDFDVSFGDINDLLGTKDIKLFNIPTSNLNLGTRKEDASIPADVMDKIKVLIAPYMVNNIAITGTNAASESATLASVPGITAIAQPENASVSTTIPLDITGGSSQSSTANNILPTSASDILRLDITTAGKDSTKLTAASLMPTGTMPVTANNGSNIVNVSDSSQQYLSSLVNVNAAGSIVPVMLNITVNINSTIGSITNNNALDLRNYSKYLIR